MTRVLECLHSCAASSDGNASREVASRFLRAIPATPLAVARWRARVRRSGVAWVVVSLRVDRPVAFDDIEEHFKYGSIGSEPGVSLLRPVGGVLPPYWVFRALPAICPERIRGGYASFGFIDRAGPRAADRRLAPPAARLDHVGMNCAACHTGTVRDTPTAAPRVVLGHAGAQARPAGVRPVRPRVLARQPADGRRGARRSFPPTASGRRCSSARCCGPGWSIA